jgi:hypothetical protein
MTRHMEGGPAWQRWKDDDGLTDAEHDCRRAREDEFLERQLVEGMAAAAARGPRRHDREWQAGISHRDEFGPGRD